MKIRILPLFWYFINVQNDIKNVKVCEEKYRENYHFVWVGVDKFLQKRFYQDVLKNTEHGLNIKFFVSASQNIRARYKSQYVEIPIFQKVLVQGENIFADTFFQRLKNDVFEHLMTKVT